MSEQLPDRLVAIVRAMLEAFNRRDVEGALADVAPDCVLRPAGTAAQTGRAEYRGHDGVREYFADVARVWDGGLRVEPVDFRAVAGSVVVYGRAHAVGADGPAAFDVIWVWKLRDELVVSGQVFPTQRAALDAAHAPA
jgi:ketosteroid isomerase-like protein